jgi:energy-coupling factor transport system substrate-specific component
METRKALNKVNTKELAGMALLSAILLIGQVGLSFLPNIEIVSLLIYIYTQIYRKKVFFIIYVFVFLEGCIYGVGLWWFGYLYIWSILALIVLLHGKQQTPVLMTGVILGAYGISFGFLYSIPYFAAGGWAAGFSYWVSGIPFDLLHCAGNVAVSLICYRPLRSLLGRLKSQA